MILLNAWREMNVNFPNKIQISITKFVSVEF